MNLSPAEKMRIRKQFDCFVKMVLRGEARSYIREIVARSKHEITFSDLNADELENILAVDEYEQDYTHFNVEENDITVRDDLLAEALSALPNQNREVILLAYFLEMGDAEIAAMLKNNRKTVYRHRITGLDMLKSLMKEEAESD